MNSIIINKDFENITNTWKKIFSEFIIVIVEDNNKLYEEHRFNCKFLNELNTCPSVWTNIFLENFKSNISDYNGINDNDTVNGSNEYSVLFMNIVYNNFIEYQFEGMPIETIKQYLKYLCIQSGLGDTYYSDVNNNIDSMNNNEKIEFSKSLIVRSSIQFSILYKDFIEDTFINILHPTSAVYLK